MRKIIDNLKYHVVDSTAVTATVTPIFAGFETCVAGMSDENSLNARILGAALNYAGLGRVFSKGRDISRKIFKIKQDSSEKVQQFHDAVYAVAYVSAFQPPFYYVAGVRDPKEIAIGTAIGMGLALVIGGPIGYVIDSFRDLTGLQKCERNSYPELLRKQRPKIKKSLATTLVAASVGLMAGIYSLTPNQLQVDPTVQQVESLEQTIVDN